MAHNKPIFYTMIPALLLACTVHISAMEERVEFTEDIYMNLRAPQVQTQAQTVISLMNLYENSPVFVRVKTGDNFDGRSTQYEGQLNPLEPIEIPRPKFGAVTLHFFDDPELAQSLGTQWLRPEDLAGLRSITVLARHGYIRSGYRNGLGLTYLYDFIGAPCEICSVNIQPEEIVTALACGHEFHQECANEWFRRVLNCPKCRKAVTNSRDFNAQMTIEEITR